MARQRKKTARSTQPPVSRRTFMQSVVAASAATGIAAFPVGAAATSLDGTTDGVTYKVLSNVQARVLTRVLNRLVPGDAEMPAAGDLGCAQFIDGVLSEAPHMRQPVLDVVDTVALASNRVIEDDADLDALLSKIEHDRKASFDALIEVAYTGYYSHHDVLHAIGWIPPGPVADTSEFFDPSLLEGVRKMGPRYRQV